MQILCIGDVVGSHGCDFLRRTLPAFKRTKGIDVVIANGENSSDGNGFTPASANHLLDSGVDIITTGNHTYRRREFYDYIDESDCIIRPAKSITSGISRSQQNIKTQKPTRYSSFLRDSQ